MEQPTGQIISVSEFLDILNETLGFAYPLVTVEGEVSSFKVNQGKWVFFDLKDGDATLSCFMPVYQLKVPLEDGMKVRVSGTPKVTKWGKFSFTAKAVSLAGEGELKRAFEILKAKLTKEGLFDEARKRLLPEYPRTIGLIASEQSAAYADFMKILGQRFGGVTVKLADVQVQGLAAPDQLCGALEYFNQLAEPVDVLVMIRGGGSLEDLQAFNTEMVARSVATSRTPIIVGVGHEIDVSLSDFAADVRAATPTDAARLVVPERSHVAHKVEFAEARMAASLDRRLRGLDTTLVRFVHTAERYISVPKEHVVRLQVQLERNFATVHQEVERRQMHIERLSGSLGERQTYLFRRYRQRLSDLQRVLAGYDPTATLRRGYSIVWHGEEVVNRTAQAAAGDVLMIQLSDGNIRTTVDHDQRT